MVQAKGQESDSSDYRMPRPNVPELAFRIVGETGRDYPVGGGDSISHSGEATMNLDANPSVEQLRDLIARCDDLGGDHVLWVTRTGDVELTTVRGEDTRDGFQKIHPEMQLRCETFLVGNQYVGPEAAKDDHWLAELFDRLLNEWHSGKGRTVVATIDRF